MNMYHDNFVQIQQSVSSTKRPWLKLSTMGCTRLVLLIGRWAIKIPRFDRGWAHGLRGLLSNLQEARLSHIDSRTCPVLFHIPGGFLIIMARCDPVNHEQWLVLRDQVVHGYWNPIPVELKRDSFGTLNGQTVVVDYGIVCKEYQS